MIKSNKKTLEEKLNFINDAKKSNIARVNISSIKIGRITTPPIIVFYLKFYAKNFSNQFS